jgi:Ca2+-binding RTX toxin-like protein
MAPRNMQSVSDRIASNVIGTVIATGQIDDLSYILNRDISAVVGPEIAGLGRWGGTAYYWDVQLLDANRNELYVTSSGQIVSYNTGTRASIGDAILSDPAARSLFVKTYGATLADMIQNPTLDGFGAWLTDPTFSMFKDLPPSLQNEIFAYARNGSDAFKGFWASFYGGAGDPDLFLGLPTHMLGVTVNMNFAALSTDPVIRAKQLDEFFAYIARSLEGQANGRQGLSLDSFLENLGDVASTVGGVFTDIMSHISFAQIGAQFGSTLGRQLGNDNLVVGTLAGSVIGTVALNVGQAIDLSTGTTVTWWNGDGTVRATSDAAEDVWSDFPNDLASFTANATIGATSSWLALELGNLIGLEGFGSEIFVTGASTLIGHTLNNLAANYEIFQNIGLTSETWFGPNADAGAAQGAFLYAFAAFFGTKLGALVVQPQTQAAVVLSSLGSSIGAIAVGGYFSATYGAEVGGSLGAYAGPIGAFVGAFVGFVVGALFGNMFGRKKPRIPTANAETVLQLPAARYGIGSEYVDAGGNLSLARTMATGARDTLNGLINLITHNDEHAIVTNAWSPTQVYGHTGGQLWVKLGGSGATKTNVGSADEAVDKGVLWALSATQIVGGDLYLKRAIYNQVRHPGQAPNLAVLSGDLQIAEDYRFYQANRAIIDTAIAEPFTSMSSAQKAFFTTNRAFMTRALAKASVPLAGTDLTFYNANQTMVDSIAADLDLSQFAAGWIITLQRAAELELNRAAPSDFYGGARGFVDSLGLSLHGERIDYESVTFNMGGADLKVRYTAEKVASPNLIAGGDTGLGTSILGSWWHGGGVPYAVKVETIEGQRAFTASKAIGEIPVWAGGQAWGGQVFVAGGGAANGFIEVKPGDVIGMAAEFKELVGGLSLYSKITFLDQNGAYIAEGGQAWANGDQWDRITGLATVPAGAAFATLEFYSVRPDGNVNGGFDFAFRNVQLHRLPPGTNSVPGWSGAPYNEFIERNFFADAGYSAGTAGTNSSANNYVNLSTSTSAVTIDDTGGDDIFIGGFGNDTLYGRGGFDWLDGNSGDDWLDGGEQNDVLLGRAGRDVLVGGNGDDHLSGGDGDESPINWSAPHAPGNGWGGIWGEGGNDTIAGGAGMDHMWGQDGDDTFIVTPDGGEFDWHDGGNGSDTLSLERFAQGVTFDLNVRNVHPIYADARTGGSGFVQAGSGWTQDYFYSIENVTGSNFNDTLSGDEIANVLRGLAGNDTLNGHGGNDTLEGGAGADQLDGSIDWDTASYERSDAGVWLDMTAGEYLGGDAEGDTYYGIEHLTGSKHADTLKGNAGYNVLKGLKGDDWFVVTAGADSYDGGDDFDTLDFADFTASGVTVTSTSFSGTGLSGTHAGMEHFVGSNQNDSITGGSGAEWIQGGKGNDTLNGGAGSDTYVFNAGDGSDTITETNANNNTLVFGDGLTWTNFAFGTSTHLTMTLGGGDQVVVNTNFATPGNNKLKFIDMGGAGSIDISEINWAAGGTNAANTITGQSWGRDWLSGYDGNDTIRGTAYQGWEQNGNVFMGGRGDDYIVASMGDDQFVFERGHGRDMIYDAGGVDTIVFGPTVAAEDVIYGIDGADLIIAIRDLANPSRTALEVWNNNGDAIRVLEGGASIFTWVEFTSGGGYYTGPTFTTIEHIIAGGTSIDLMKLDLPYGVAYGGGAYYPVVFDLGGDGLDLISVNQSEVVIQGDDERSPMMRVGWVDGQDGMLAIDRNGDGEISRMSEISFRDEVKGAKTDMEGLVAFDSNGDGALDASDKRWSELKLWRDVNQNGIGKGKEVVGLEEAGIVRIELKLAPTGFTTKDGRDNVALNTAVFHWANGKTGTVHDVALASKLAHIEGMISGKWREEWSGQPQDGALGRAVAPNGRSEAQLVSAKGLDYAPEQNLGFARDDANDGVADLAPIISKKGTIEDLQKELDARAKGQGAPASAGSAAPIAIDLDGDGVQLIAPEDSTVFFDVNQDGWMDQLGWVGPTDGLLALDRDGDNRISLMNEISFVGDMPGAKTDLEGLAAFDSDGDGALTASDARWSDFRIWRDANQDGRSTGAELITLDAAGISGIDLTGRVPAERRRTMLAEAEHLNEASGPQMKLRGVDLLPYREIAPVTEGSANAALSETDASGLSNTVHAETSVTLKGGGTVVGLDLSLGSISGIELAIRQSQRDYASLLTQKDDYAVNPSFSPWAYNADVRRMLMDPGGSDAPADRALDTPVTDAAGATAQEKGFGAGERIALQPEEEASFTDTQAYGEATLERQATRPALNDAIMADASDRPRVQMKRWWNKAAHDDLPQAGQRGDSLARLMGVMAASQTVPQDNIVPRGRDRAIPLDPELARSAGQLREAMAAFGDRRNGSEWRKASDTGETSRNALVPSLWKRNTLDKNDRQGTTGL